ncbi:hypothetical protein [Kitasatospora sp. NPDC002040]|uniref:hypothetical protein n=1 Tax=Kitasatospora sp. NPDC002040 TaxID=3154661 RepID=UPI0033240BFC
MPEIRRISPWITLVIVPIVAMGAFWVISLLPQTLGGLGPSLVGEEKISPSRVKDPGCVAAERVFKSLLYLSDTPGNTSMVAQVRGMADELDQARKLAQHADVSNNIERLAGQTRGYADDLLARPTAASSSSVISGVTILQVVCEGKTWPERQTGQ